MADMSVRVEKLTKKFGSQVAVDHINFELRAGEITGFIGPNGAGKSTTMKMITGTLSPDHGSVFIKGVSLDRQLKNARRQIGYLPENNPLYPDMYIREYLEYVAGLYGYRGKDARERIASVISLTGLHKEIRKKIGALSKGYRQRVGLAQAMVHDPEILILDEPTTGLDPNQLVEIRQLISDVGKEKTVLLSTHFMQEVEAICDRIMIIDEGRLVANEKAGELKDSLGKKQTILIELAEGTEAGLWEQLSFIRKVRVMEDGRYLLETEEERDIRADIFNFAVNQQLTILSLHLKEKGLEEVFQELTRN